MTGRAKKGLQVRDGNRSGRDSSAGQKKMANFFLATKIHLNTNRNIHIDKRFLNSFREMALTNHTF